MKYITFADKVALGTNDRLNEKLNLRISFIIAVLEILERHGIKAEINMVAQAIESKGTIYFEIGCGDNAFKETLTNSLNFFNGEF